MTAYSDAPVVSADFAKVLQFICDTHSHQIRKTTGVPYLSHLLGVASILQAAGFEEKVVLAGLLHDSFEDAEVGFATIVDLLNHQEVATIVKCCTNRMDNDLKEQSRPAIAVRLADALHNCQTLIFDFDSISPSFSKQQLVQYEKLLYAVAGMRQDPAWQRQYLDSERLQKLAGELRFCCERLQQLIEVEESFQ